MKRLVAAALAAALAGCALGPNYRRPAAPVTRAFRGQERAQLVSFADLPWWDVLRDPALAGLLREALQNNYDLQAAVARVQVARQQAHIATDALLPAIGVRGSPSYQQVFNPFQFPGASGNFRYASYQLQGTLSWEIDLWGRLRRLREAALAQFLAAEENRRGVIVSLVAAVAQGYFNLMSLDMQLEIAHETVESRRQTLTLFQVRERGGVGDGLETASQAASVEGAEATIPDLERQIVQTENQLSVLIGRVPGPIPRARDLLHRPPPEDQPTGLPASLLERRPDVRQAEAQLVAANAQVGAALAAILPQVSLNASGGVQTAVLENLFTPAAVIYSVAGLVNWLAPVLNGAQNIHQYQAQRANYLGAVADYRHAVINAYAEVANALVTIRTLRELRAVLEREISARQRALELSRARYVNGVASYLDVVQAEQFLFPVQLQLAQTIAGQFTAVADLYRALGGGWQVPASATAARQR